MMVLTRATGQFGSQIIENLITLDAPTSEIAAVARTQENAQMSVMVEQIIASNILAVVSDDIVKVTGAPAASLLSYAKSKLASRMG